MFDSDTVGREWVEREKRPPTDLELAALLSGAPELNKGALSVATRKVIEHCLAEQGDQDGVPVARR